jgi:hypothetical protein
MASITGLDDIEATSVANSGQFYLTDQIESGTTGQAILSQGPDDPATWGTPSGTILNPLTMGTNLSLASGNPSFDGSVADTINATAAPTLTAGNGINNTGGTGTQNQVLKVPNTLTITDSAGTSVIYDGSTVRTITINDNDNQLILTQGANIIITNTGGFGRTIALNADITNQDTITFTSTSGTTALTGNSYPNNQTPMTNFDLTDTSNIVSPYFFHDVYDPASLDSDSLTTSYANIFSSNLFNSFTAQQTSCNIELRVYNAQFTTSGRFTYARLAGSSSTTSGAEFTSFYSTGGRATERIFHQADESDDVYLSISWFLTGLTIGNTYNLYPQMRSSSTSNSIYAGSIYPSAILRGYYLPSTGI